jgi:hypothetical protein
MELYIRIHNGQPVDHPILGDNFREAFPEVDTDSLPDHFAPFKRKSWPTEASLGSTNPYQIVDVRYVLDTDGVTWTDEYFLRDLTPEEKAQKIAHVRAAEPYQHPSWVFNEDICGWEPPTPMPTDTSKVWEWDEVTVSWKDVTPEPMQITQVSFK